MIINIHLRDLETMNSIILKTHITAHNHPTRVPFASRPCTHDVFLVRKTKSISHHRPLQVSRQPSPEKASDSSLRGSCFSNRMRQSRHCRRDDHRGASSSAHHGLLGAVKRSRVVAVSRRIPAGETASAPGVYDAATS